MDTVKEKYGWMSHEQANVLKSGVHLNKQYGGPYKIYLNEKGEEVKVTAISYTKDHGCRFSDMTFVGMVKEYVRSEH